MHSRARCHVRGGAIASAINVTRRLRVRPPRRQRPIYRLARHNNSVYVGGVVRGYEHPPGNMHVEQLCHADMWLASLFQDNKARGFTVLPAMGECGRRILVTMSVNVKCWGGAWLPTLRGCRPKPPGQMDLEALEYFPEVVKYWVRGCEEMVGRRLQLGDEVLPALH